MKQLSKQLSCVCVILVIATGCSTTPKARAGTDVQSDTAAEMESALSTIKSQTIIPSTPNRPGISPDRVYSFCSAVSDNARGSSANFSIAGWATAIPAAVGLFYAAQVGTDPTHKTIVRRNPGTILLASSAILGAVSAFFFSRADAATTASVRAHNAHTTGDANEAYAECVAAKSYWIGSRTESNTLARNMKDSSIPPNPAVPNIPNPVGPNESTSAALVKDAPTKEAETTANQLKDVQQKLQDIAKRLDAISPTPARPAEAKR